MKGDHGVVWYINCNKSWSVSYKTNGIKEVPMSQLVDAFNRKITYMRISVTDRCNLRCVYCVPSCGTISTMPSKDLLTFDEMHRIIKVAARMGLTKVRITGGEPLVRRGVGELLE